MSEAAVGKRPAPQQSTPEVVTDSTDRVSHDSVRPTSTTTTGTCKPTKVSWAEQASAVKGAVARKAARDMVVHSAVADLPHTNTILGVSSSCMGTAMLVAQLAPKHQTSTAKPASATNVTPRRSARGGMYGINGVCMQSSPFSLGVQHSCRNSMPVGIEKAV